MKIKLIFALFFFLFLANAQNMKEGFSYLEKGEFAKAEMFFTSILKDYPENKTAQICYARALGLNSDPKKALLIFKNLQLKNPNDLEIDLNYAEALLWNKNYKVAKYVYEELVQKNPTNFVAHLGYANTLSNLKEYEKALNNVNKALELSPANPGALISRKYIKLGYANEFITDKKYNEAEKFYDEILTDYPNDKETLLNKANLYLISKEIKKGKDVYNILANDNPNISLNGLSLLSHIDGNESQALKYAKESLEKSKEIKDESIVKSTKERYAQALIWNKKYKDANVYINELREKYGDENWILALKATLSVYKSDFRDSILDYQNILKKDSLSFDGNLGIANSFYANGKIDNAYKAVYQTLKVFPKQKDAVNFLKKLHAEHSPLIEEKISYAFDNGNNEALASLTQVTLPTSTSFYLFGSYQYRQATNKNTNVKATTQDFLLGGTYKFHPKAQFTFTAGSSSANSFTNNYKQGLINTYFKIKPYKLQDLEIGYKREMQNFNADLIDKQIITQNYYLNYSLSTNKKIGWYSQYFYTTQSDMNVRNLLFTSLYYNFSAKPYLKGGVNYQYLGFKNQVPIDYFSPSKFNAVELFFDLLKEDNSAEKHTFYYFLSGAVGYQTIEESEKQSTYRMQGKLGFRFSENFRMHVYGLKSNIASTTVAGFVYNEVGVNLRLIIGKKPIFKTE